MVLLIGPDGCGHEDHLVDLPSEIRSEGVGAPKSAVARDDERLPIVLRSRFDTFRSVSKLGRDAGNRPPTRIGGRAYHGVVRFEVLGPTRVVAAVRAGTPTERPLPPSLGGPKQRLVLAMLLAEPNRVVSVDRLVDGLWGDDPPGTARHTVQSYVSELRKSLGSVITREGAGYKIGVDADTFDILDFESRIVSGSSAVTDRSSGCCGNDQRMRSHCGGVRRSTTSAAVRLSRGRWRGWRNSAWPRSRR